MVKEVVIELWLNPRVVLGIERNIIMKEGHLLSILRKSTMWVQITPSYIFANIFSSSYFCKFQKKAY